MVMASSSSFGGRNSSGSESQKFNRKKKAQVRFQPAKILTQLSVNKVKKGWNLLKNAIKNEGIWKHRRETGWHEQFSENFQVNALCFLFILTKGKICLNNIHFLKKKIILSTLSVTTEKKAWQGHLPVPRKLQVRQRNVHLWVLLVAMSTSTLYNTG